MYVFTEENAKKLLFKDLENKLDWLFEEFVLMFNFKINKLTTRDVKIANDIIDYILANQTDFTTIEAYNLFTKKITELEETYSKLLFENNVK